MPDSPLPTSPPEQVVRFRLRTLLAITTIMAILAAIAGPYYRMQNASAQRSLLAFWATVLLFCLTGLALNWRSHTAVNPRMGPVRFVTIRAWQRWIGPIVQGSMLACALGWLAYKSHQTVENSAKKAAVGMPAVVEIVSVVGRGLWSGVVVSGMTMCILRVPIYLCENGVPYLGMSIVWRQFSEAEWAPSDRGVLQLCRRDGDLYLYVSPDQRQEVLEFVRNKVSRSKERPNLAADL